MYEGDWGATTGLLELVVMEESNEGLEDEEGDYDGAEDGVGFACGFVEIVCHLRQLNANSKSTDQSDQAEDLEKRMQACISEQSHVGGAQREQQNNRCTHDNTVCLLIIRERLWAWTNSRASGVRVTVRI